MEKELPKNWLKIGEKYVFSDVEWGGTGLTFVTDNIVYLLKHKTTLTAVKEVRRKMS